MNVRPSILCPIDYSEASVGALRYAAALAEHFVTRLIVLNVEDPLLIAAMDMGTGLHWSPEDAARELTAFVAHTFDDDPSALAMCEYEVVVGKPGAEIVRVARERSCDLIVMSTHGLTGVRKFYFGSTTERVLRETSVPVLATPPANPGRIRVEDARRVIGRIVVPVDLSPESAYQAEVATGLAVALNVPLVFVHVLEPVRSRVVARLNLGKLGAERRAFAEDELGVLLERVPKQLACETLIVHGDPAEEAARVVRDRHAGLVVMGLHGSPWLGPRMGSVTYRMLCLCPTLVLALPPKRVASSHRHAADPCEAGSVADR